MDKIRYLPGINIDSHGTLNDLISKLQRIIGKVPEAYQSSLKYYLTDYFSWEFTYHSPETVGECKEREDYESRMNQIKSDQERKQYEALKEKYGE